MIKREALSPTQKALVANNAKFARYMVTKHYLWRARGQDPDDLFSVAFEALVIAATKYDPAHASGAAFVTYAGRWIRALVGQHLKSEQEKMKPLKRGLDEPLNPDPSDDSAFETLKDKLASPGNDPEELLAAKRSSELVAELVESIDCPRNREIMRRMYLSGSEPDLGDISREFGVTRQRVAQIKDRCIALLRSRVAA